MEAVARPDVLADLRARVAVLGTPASPAMVLPFGVAALDARLAGGGMAGGALHEIAPAAPTLAEDAAASLFLAGIAARFGTPNGIVLWALTRFDLYSPAIEQAGLAPDRVLFAEARDDQEVLALMEDALRHGGMAAVVGEARRADMTATRRLQLAAAEHRTPALLLRRWRRAGQCPLSTTSAAMTRWRIGCAPSVRLGVPGVGRACWSVDLVRQRNGDPFTLILEGCDAQGRLAVPAAAPDRAIAADGATARAA